MARRACLLRRLDACRADLRDDFLRGLTQRGESRVWFYQRARIQPRPLLSLGRSFSPDFPVQPPISYRIAPTENTPPPPAYSGNHLFGRRPSAHSPDHTLVTSASAPPTVSNPRGLFPVLLRLRILCRSDHRNLDRSRRPRASLLSTLPCQPDGGGIVKGTTRAGPVARAQDAASSSFPLQHLALDLVLSAGRSAEG